MAQEADSNSKCTAGRLISRHDSEWKEFCASNEVSASELFDGLICTLGDGYLALIQRVAEGYASPD